MRFVEPGMGFEPPADFFDAQKVVGVLYLARNSADIKLTLGAMILDEATGTTRDVHIVIAEQQPRSHAWAHSVG